MRSLPETPSEQQAEILKLIIENQRIKLREIAEVLNVDIGSISRPIRYLIAKSYIVKNTPRARGDIKYYITPKAQRWYEENV